eukprot:m.13780 g.13780  ORF g.13780 m.13780 type:complete len:765 (+) comp25217_c0_seq2:97-2391(+)
MAYRSRKSYSVSKNSNSVHIKLLDGTDADFSFGWNSTGQECLDRVTQLLDLDESYIFGLQFEDRSGLAQWVDLDRNLRKQLDKKTAHGARDSEVFFRVRFFPTDASILQQEVSKYLLYLQLRENVTEGKLACTEEQAVLLASYAIQAEFEDHDRAVHTAQYMSSFLLFPEHIKTPVTELNKKVSELHRKNRGMSQAAAELAYIRQAQQLKGYGHEGCPALDEDGNQLEVGACYLGVYVKHFNGMPTVYFKWPEIVSIKRTKTFLEIEVRDVIIQFQMGFKDLAEYAHHLVVSQHHFYRLQTVGGSKLQGVGRFFKTQFQASHYSKAFVSKQSSLARKKTLSRSGNVGDSFDSELNSKDSLEMTTFKEANGSSSLKKIKEQETVLSVEEDRPRKPPRAHDKDDTFTVEHVLLTDNESSSHIRSREKSVSPSLSVPDTDDELEDGIDDDVGVIDPPESHSRINVSPTRTTMIDTLRKKLESNDVLVEYDSVPKKFLDQPLVTLPISEVKAKNRFKDIIPYDSTRVRLDPSNNRTESDYINANHISMEIAGEPHHYIAAQGPLVSTAADFWQMIWENDARLIVMVTSEIENNRIKCYRYWPSEGGEDSKVEHGQFEVSSQYFNDTGITITRGFSLLHMPSGETRTVWHLQYVGWPDHGVPSDPETFLAFVEEMDTLRRHGNNTSDDPNMNPPTVVHCSAGVGRTGVTILMELVIKTVQKNESIDISEYLRILRSQRMALVQTAIQYKFCYQAFLTFLSQSSESNRLI